MQKTVSKKKKKMRELLSRMSKIPLYYGPEVNDSFVLHISSAVQLLLIIRSSVCFNVFRSFYLGWRVCRALVPGTRLICPSQLIRDCHLCCIAHKTQTNI